MIKKIKFPHLFHTLNGIYGYRLALQDQSLDTDIVLICETNHPKWSYWKNPTCKTYNARVPSSIYGGTVVLFKSNIQHALVTILMLS